jgi:hypothetical protein
MKKSALLPLVIMGLFLFTACNNATNTPVALSTQAVPTATTAPTTAPATTAPLPSVTPRAATTPPAQRTTPVSSNLPAAYTKTDTPDELLTSYYNAISRKEYDRAYSYWREGSDQRAKDAKEFSYGFLASQKITAQFGNATTNGAAGTIYAEVPAIIFETTADGKDKAFCGKYVLNRSNDVPGATKEQLSWRIFRVEVSLLATAPKAGSPEVTGLLQNNCKAGSAATNPTLNTGNSTALRQIKWLDVLKADSAFIVESLPLGGNTDQHLTLKAAKEVYGYPQLDGIIYVDMDGDKIEEAAFPLFSGGTAGNLSFLVYKQASPAPKLVAWDTGYKLGLKLEQGKLVAGSALYAGWEPNCCPSGFSYITYTLENNKLVKSAARTEGIIEAQPETINQFYQLINDKKLDSAYKMLSQTYQKANPYNTWSAGFTNTVKVEVETSPVPGVANTVQIKITSVDKGNVTKTFSGTWKLEWGGEKGWLLNVADIKEAGNAATPAKGQVLAPFQPVLTKLKSGGFPVYLPTFIEGYSGNEKLYANVVKVDAKGYEVILGFTPDCGGGTACRLGTLYAEVVANNAAPLKGTAVNLTDGIKGYFTDFTCGANCSDATLTWQSGNVRYTVGIKAGEVTSLTKMANSAITNGKL